MAIRRRYVTSQPISIMVAANVSAASARLRATLKVASSPAAIPVVATPVIVALLRVFAVARLATVTESAVLKVGAKTSSVSAMLLVAQVNTIFFVASAVAEKKTNLISMPPVAVQSEGSIADTEDVL